METTVSSRNLNIGMSRDKMEAYISISYSPNEEGELPPKFTLDELKRELDKASIVNGIIDGELEKCINEDIVTNLVIARGEKAIDGKDDVLELKFQVDANLHKLNEDSKGKVDFKSIGAVDPVFKGDVIAVRYQGDDGKSGKDVTGKEIKPKPGKKIQLKVNEGCEIKNENTVVSLIDGKPCIKSNTFYVFKTHEVPQDVDIKTGNIVFVGDITIKGNVKDGMKVVSGNSVNILKNVERAEIVGKGEINIKGNVIASRVLGGGEDTEKLKEIESLTMFEKSLKELIEAIEEVKKYNLFGYNTSDGQIVKLLIESKFKLLPKICLTIMSQAIKNSNKEDIEVEKILNFIKSKLIGISPLNIKHYSEVCGIADVVSSRIIHLKQNLSIPVNVLISYCQDSQIESSGDIVITGRGAYISTITAQNNIYFTNNNSVVRGGTIKAGKEIKCKIVGSQGGTYTKIQTAEKGQIWIDVAYENTVISIGNRETIINHSCKDVHAYLDKDYELVIDSLRL